MNYDLDYFFDQITTSPDKKSKFKEDDLDGISDQELIEGARKIELISEVGYKQLDLIRYMRNFASAAHPNQNELTAYQLMGWFDVIIKEVIAIKEPNTAVNIKQLLGNIKINKVDSEQKAKEMISFLKDAPQIQINNLCRGLFGIYTRQDANQISIDNIKLLLPKIWYFVGNSTKFEFGIYSNNLATKIKSNEFKYDKDATYSIPVFIDNEGSTKYELLVTFPLKKKFLFVEVANECNGFYGNN